ncbi:MAG: hypothetical protein U9Q92_04190 [archaeon]|nr:hypothetical protein [archaeon]
MNAKLQYLTTTLGNASVKRQIEIGREIHQGYVPYVDIATWELFHLPYDKRAEIIDIATEYGILHDEETAVKLINKSKEKKHEIINGLQSNLDGFREMEYFWLAKLIQNAEIDYAEDIEKRFSRLMFCFSRSIINDAYSQIPLKVPYEFADFDMGIDLTAEYMISETNALIGIIEQL